MTKPEFSEVIAYLEAAVGKPIAPTPTEGLHRMRVYFDLLGDLPLETLRIAAKRAALAHPWNTFPSVAELRQAASETLQGQVRAISPGEAWGQVCRAIKSIDPEHSGPWMARDRAGVMRHWSSRVEWATDGMPPLVFEAMRLFGVANLCNANPEYAQRDFVRIYSDLLARESARALLPAALQQQITTIGREERLRRLQQQIPVVAAIGVEAS